MSPFTTGSGNREYNVSFPFPTNSGEQYFSIIALEYGLFTSGRALFRPRVDIVWRAQPLRGGAARARLAWILRLPTVGARSKGR